MIGRVLGSFRLTEEIGTGGMGVVYGAEHTLIGKPAAVKVLRPELSANEVVVKRFFHEAKATSSIEHPGIVEVFDFGFADDGAAYIVMERLRGETLRARLARVDRMGVDEALRLTAQLASALDAAHGAGIVHRDLKPGNLFLVKDPDMPGGERLRILDFGIAKLTTSDSGMNTASGVLIGTPVYMSPEQCAGAGKVDHRADLYAVGCILYEAVSGKRPFSAKGRGEMIAMHLFDTAPPVSEAYGDVPVAVEQLIDSLLEKEPNARPQSAAELARLVREAQTNPPRSRPVSASQGLDAETLTPLETGMSDEPVAKPPEPKRALWKIGVPVAVLAMAVVGFIVARPGSGSKNKAAVVRSDAGIKAPAAIDASPPADATVALANPADAARVADPRWVRLEPPSAALVLGVTGRGNAAIPKRVSGLRPSRRVMAPTRGFELQRHEVTWAELEPWLASNADALVYRPSWLPTAAKARASLPATGIPWQVAYRYCRSLGGNLPSEEQWEYAARGSARRPYPWGSARIDLARTRAYQGRKAVVHSVTDYDQDITPAPAISGMVSNAREWTSSLWREDEPGKDESWVQQGGNVFRVVRGLPFGAPAPALLPTEAVAFRDALCAAPACLKGNESALQYVGFRCARPLR